jgi:hypothetical protein
MVNVKNVRAVEVQCSKVEYYLMPRFMFSVDKILDCRKYASALLTPIFMSGLSVFMSARVLICCLPLGINPSDMMYKNILLTRGTCTLYQLKNNTIG